MVSGISDWVVDTVDRIGEVGVGALIALENVFPPIPSEVILPLAGYRAEQGALNVGGVWVAATVGALVGAMILYGIGALVGAERLHQLAGKPWFVLFGEKDLDRGERWFERHGDKVVLFCRFIPLLRSVVSVPAGISRMPLPRFLLLTAIGSGIWNAVFIGFGWALGDRYEQVERYVGPVSYAVVGVLAVAVVVLAVRHLRRRREVAPA